MSFRAEIQAFFDAYMAAYLRLDPAGFSACFDLPCLISDAAGDHVIAGASDLEAYMRPFLDRLRADRLRSIALDILRAEELGAADGTCTTRCRILAENGRVIGDMEFHYFLCRSKGAWRIKFARIGRIHAWSESDVWRD